jgi:hypothetical protein
LAYPRELGKKSSETGEQMKSEGSDFQASASSDLDVDPSNGMEDEHKYLSPVEVFSLMLGLSVSAFLLALDSTVLSTVSCLLVGFVLSEFCAVL